MGESNVSPKKSTEISAFTESIYRGSIRIESIYFFVMIFASESLV